MNEVQVSVSFEAHADGWTDPPPLIPSHVQPAQDWEHTARCCS